MRRKRLRKEINQFNKTFWKLTRAVLLGYLVAIVLFYFLAGEQLHFRQSRGDIPLPESDSGTVELTAGNIDRKSVV